MNKKEEKVAEEVMLKILFRQGLISQREYSAARKSLKIDSTHKVII